METHQGKAKIHNSTGSFLSLTHLEKTDISGINPKGYGTEVGNIIPMVLNRSCGRECGRSHSCGFSNYRRYNVTIVAVATQNF